MLVTGTMIRLKIKDNTNFTIIKPIKTCAKFNRERPYLKTMTEKLGSIKLHRLKSKTNNEKTKTGH
jgi:hypothetical protein